jgi:hypothetical protein
VARIHPGVLGNASVLGRETKESRGDRTPDDRAFHRHDHSLLSHPRTSLSRDDLDPTAHGHKRNRRNRGPKSRLHQDTAGAGCSALSRHTHSEPIASKTRRRPPYRGNISSAETEAATTMSRPPPALGFGFQQRFWARYAEPLTPSSVDFHTNSSDHHRDHTPSAHPPAHSPTSPLNLAQHHISQRQRAGRPPTATNARRAVLPRRTAN